MNDIPNALPLFAITGPTTLSRGLDLAPYPAHARPFADAEGRGPLRVLLFTDRVAARQFCDEHAPGQQVEELGAATTVATTLRSAEGWAAAVAFDPQRGGAARVFGLDEVIAHFEAQPR